MDFSAVPAGTAAPAALALCAADHDVEFAVASRFNSILGDAVNATNAAAVANTKAAPCCLHLSGGHDSWQRLPDTALPALQQRPAGRDAR